jgi:CHASE3 domain sensor protein
MGYNRSGNLSGGTFSLYFLLTFLVVLFLVFASVLSLIGVIRRGGQQVTATQTVLVGVGRVGILSGISQRIR